MKTIVTILIFGMFAISFNACKKDHEVADKVKPTAIIPEEIRTNLTLRSDTVYTFTSGVFVTNNAVLTIEPGTVIRSNNGEGTNNARGFVIDRGAKIMAIGTADNPIVFTSGVKAGNRQHGQWEGLYILGKAPVSAYDDNTGGPAEEISLKGLGAGFPAGGGNDPADNSGVLKYVRIEFAGKGNADSYGLACVGVGSGTVIEHVQTSYTQTSGFGFYGGTVNARNLVAFNNRLAGFVYANGYTGRQQFILSYKHPYFAATGSYLYTCDAVVILNDIQNNPVINNTRPVISNLTVIGPYNNPGYNNALPWNAAININYGSALALRNSVIMGMPKGGIKFSDDMAALHLMDGSTVFTNNLVHSNIPEEAFGVDPNFVYSIDNTTVNAYASDNNNIAYNKPEEIQLTNPFIFEKPMLLPKAGSPALSGTDFSGADFSSFFENVTYKGAFGPVNWIESWTNFYPVTTPY